VTVTLDSNLTETLNILFPVVNFLNVLLQKSSSFKFSFKTLDISQGSVGTYLRCGGILVIVLLLFSSGSFLPSLGSGRANCHTASAEVHLKAGPLRNPTPY